jgi:uncharacterized protein YjbI with pentapeptide repeats
MEKDYIVDKKFEKINYTEKPLRKADYEGCQFINCDLSNSDLSGINFTECNFTGCNLSSAKLIQTTFGDVQFKDCKLLGLHFENCNEFVFAIEFENCILDLCSFYKRKLRKVLFKVCSLCDVDFTEADLSNAVLTQCNLKGAKFENTILERADLSSSYNYSIDPQLNRIKRAKFSYPGVIGLLDKFDIDLA